MEEILREVQKFYVWRDKEKWKQKATIMLSTIEQMTENIGGLKAQE
jgi:hypothetical protein